MANRVSVEFGATTGELTSAVQEVNSSIDSVKQHVESLTDGFRTLAEIAGVALTFEGLRAAFDSLAAFADEVQNAQAKMGGTLESMTTLSGIATMAGVAFRSLTAEVASANLQVQRSTADAYGPAAQGLKSLGLSAQELVGLPADQWFARVSDAVSRFNPSITLTSNVQQAFGRGFGELMPLLMQGSDHFRELQEAVAAAQAGLSAALPGISETEEKLNLLGLRSRAFAAQVFSTLKPAIDSAIDAFSNLTASIKPDDIRDAANKVANALIDIGADVARFFARAGLEVDLFKAKFSGGFTLKFPEQDEKDVKSFLLWFSSITGRSEQVRRELEKPFPSITIGASSGEDPTAKLNEQLGLIDEYQAKARAAVNSAIPKSGSWEALGQDMARLNQETLDAAGSFAKLNAAMANNNVKSQLAARATAIEAEIAAEQAKLERIKTILNQEASAGRLTMNERALATETAIAEIYGQELALVDQKIALYARGSREYEAAEKERVAITNRYNKEMLTAVQQSVKEMAASITSGLQAFTSSFNSQLQGLLARTESFGQAAINIGRDMFMKLIELGEQWVVKHAAALIADAVTSKTTTAADVASHAAAEAAKTTATVTGSAARTAAETTASAAGIGTQIANAVTSVMIDTGKVFAGVFGFLAPVMGPAAAGPAEASAAEALAGGMAPLAVGAWEIPSVMPALLHPGEMVVPATFASGLRSMFSGGGAGAPGGGPTFAPIFQNFVGNQAFINAIMPQMARILSSYQSRTPSLSTP